ncbi:MAG: hypothetical protein ACYCY7_09740 [Gallionella sp.]
MMTRFTQTVIAAWAGIVIAGLSGCGEGEKAPPPAPVVPAAPLTIGGSVTGLTGNGLVIQLNGANDLAVSANGKFNFPKNLTKGSAYSVTVKVAPFSPVKQSCTVAQGSGTIAAAAISNVTINCTTDSYAIGGTVSGLAGKGLVLQLNGTTDLAIATNGKFIFPGVHLPDGSDYNVAIKSTPAKRKCTIKPVSAAFDKDTLNIVSVTCSAKGHRK